jgi:hypothetical protein
LKSTAAQRFASTAPGAVAKRAKPVFLQTAVKTRGGQEFWRRSFAEQGACKNKKPGKAGLFDELHFRSVHFASLAI